MAIARGDLAGPRAVGFVVAAIVFLVAFAATCRTPSSRRRTAVGMRVTQSLAAIGMVWLGYGVVTSAVFVVIASQLPSIVSSGVAAAWITTQSIAIAWRFDALHVAPAFASCAAFTAFQGFALAAAALVASARRGRDVAVEHSRALERLRVARDLHDTLGHHLTALSMQLEVAARVTDGRAKEHIERAHGIGKLLLADLRSAVSDLREPRPLGMALRALVAAPGTLVVHLALAPQLEGIGGDQAEALVRCVQELMTNVERHAGAQNVWITITAGRSAIRLVARDDGQTAPTVIAWGNGLTGMRERFSALGGSVDAGRRAAGGFEVEASMPRRRP